MLQKVQCASLIASLDAQFCYMTVISPSLVDLFFSLLFAVFIKPLLTTLWKASLGLGENDALS